ncbi:hypothetical protein EYF80_046271 [Liparis tanakae]|uniref:Uncharacterized protein n=1 Tax=Liparis tanakae TaxID=230148 RepID=A0A4Z2FQX3_9TELE|nr:hypothetical protein EYF80_046271 [Liparis tanakae]
MQEANFSISGGGGDECFRADFKAPRSSCSSCSAALLFKQRAPNRRRSAMPRGGEGKIPIPCRSQDGRASRVNRADAFKARELQKLL